jgi:hypothetical protein
MLDFEIYDHLWPQFSSIDPKEDTPLPRGLTILFGMGAGDFACEQTKRPIK